MNLQCWIKSLSAVKRAARRFWQPRRPRLGESVFGQNGPVSLKSKKRFMLSLLSVRRAAFCFGWGLWLGVSVSVFGQTNYYSPNGTEYAVVGSLPGDQVWPDAAVTPMAVSW